MSTSKKLFDVAKDRSERDSGEQLVSCEVEIMATDVDEINDNEHDIQDILLRLQTIEKNQQTLSKGQATLVNNQEVIARKLGEIADNLSLKPEMAAQTKALMECKVYIKKVEGSICRITGETKESSKTDEVAAMLPLRTFEDVNEIEKKLKAKDFAKAVCTFMHAVKGVSEDAHNVIRSMFADDLLQYYNWDGRYEKRAFSNLYIYKVLEEVFQNQSASELKKNVKLAIDRSHHRQKQKMYIQKKNISKSKYTNIKSSKNKKEIKL